MMEVVLMNRIDVHGGAQRRDPLTDSLRNTRLRLHLSGRRRREELPLLDDQEMASAAQTEGREQTGGPD
jgi:hypothetical protein